MCFLIVTHIPGCAVLFFYQINRKMFVSNSHLKDKEEHGFLMFRVNLITQIMQEYHVLLISMNNCEKAFGTLEGETCLFSFYAFFN